MDNSFKNRRKYFRIYRNFILSYYVKGEPTATREVSQLNNISKGGASFVTTHAIKEGEIVIVDLKTPFISDSIQLEGAVLGCVEKIPDMIYEIRLQFQNIPEQAMALLDKIECYSKSNED